MEWTTNHNASTTHLEVVTIYRPTRVLAAVCCFLSCIGLIIAVSPTAWVRTMDGFGSRDEGLFRVCPFEDGMKSDCMAQTKDFATACAALVIIALVLVFAAGCLVVYGMRTQHDDIKKILYKLALALVVLCAVLLLISLIVFPSLVHRRLRISQAPYDWEILWAYMLAWAVFVIMVAAILLLALDRKPDETSVREKIVSH